MDYKNNFKIKCKHLQTYLKELNTLLYDIEEKIIIRDLEKYFKNEGENIKLSAGSNIINYDEIDEVFLDGEVFTIINKGMEKYFGFVVILEKEFCTIGLGFMYNDKIISPHMDFEVGNILNKYNKDELIDIISIIDEKIELIKSDIEYINTHKDLNYYKYHYGEYNKGFPSNIKFDTINEILEFYYNE